MTQTKMKYSDKKTIVYACERRPENHSECMDLEIGHRETVGFEPCEVITAKEGYARYLVLVLPEEDKILAIAEPAGVPYVGEGQILAVAWNLEDPLFARYRED